MRPLVGQLIPKRPPDLHFGSTLGNSVSVAPDSKILDDRLEIIESNKLNRKSLVLQTVEPSVDLFGRKYVDSFSVFLSFAQSPLNFRSFGTDFTNLFGVIRS